MPLQESPNQASRAAVPWVWQARAPKWLFSFPPVEDEPQLVPETPPSPTGEAKEKLRVLVVEDNRDAAHTLQDLMEGIGYEVAVAYAGTDGVDAALQCLPHVVLCDIGLPGMDGYAVAATLKQDPRTAKARLIAITGYNREEDLRRSKEAGFEIHLVKPVDLDELEQLLAAAAAALSGQAPRKEADADA